MYGSSEDPAQFETLVAYSPCQNIEKGVEYPAMFLTAGENEGRIPDIADPRIFIMRLLAKTAD